MQHVILKDILDCNLSEQMRVRDIRNQNSVRQVMYTDHLISKEEHLTWLDNLGSDQTQRIFVIQVPDDIAGVVSLNAISQQHKRADWAFYMDESYRGSLVVAVEFFFLNYVFKTLKLEKLNCEIIENNKHVVSMHKRFFFTQEGFRRSQIEKDGRRLGVYFLGITKEDWETASPKFSQTYHMILENFEVTMNNSTEATTAP